MQEENYLPYYVEDVEQIDMTTAILSVWPKYDCDENYSYELIFVADSFSISHLFTYVGKYIVVDIISNSKMEIFYGEFYQECFSDFEFSYQRFDMIKKLKIDLF